MRNTILLSIVLVLTLSACRNQFVTSNYEQTKKDHKIIAVLPMKSTFTGNIPDDITAEDIMLIEDAESVRFQEVLMEALIYESGIRRNDIGIGFQSLQVTNNKLKAMGVSVRESWTMDPVALADSLGVDAIVRGYVTKNRFISDMESMKISLAEGALRAIANSTGAPLPIPGGVVNTLKRTYYIESGVEVLDGEAGAILWKMFTYRNADWSYTPEMAQRNMAYQFANQFPYRNKEFKK